MAIAMQSNISKASLGSDSVVINQPAHETVFLLHMRPDRIFTPTAMLRATTRSQVKHSTNKPPHYSKHDSV